MSVRAYKEKPTERCQDHFNLEYIKVKAWSGDIGNKCRVR
jgi:hypothetical protein